MGGRFSAEVVSNQLVVTRVVKGQTYNGVSIPASVGWQAGDVVTVVSDGTLYFVQKK